MGRFINADAFATTGQGLLGNNMFAYCGNNPVKNTDSSGNRYVDAVDFAGGGVGCTTTGFAPNGPFSPGTPGSLGKKIIDFVTNEDERVVLEAESIAFYKGTLVVKTNLERSGSYGIIFLQEDINSIDYPEDMVRHEYGHIKQLEELGFVKYSFCVFLPSWQKWGSDKYYDKPWEVTADIMGGVRSRNPTQEKIDAGFAYLDASDKLGPIAWATIS